MERLKKLFDKIFSAIADHYMDWLETFEENERLRQETKKLNKELNNPF